MPDPDRLHPDHPHLPRHPDHRRHPRHPNPHLRSTDPAYSDFSLTTLRCRQLLFQFPGQLLACPRTDDSCVILVGGWCAVVLVLMMVFSCLL